MTNQPLSSRLEQASRQQQFLEVIGRDEAMARFAAHLHLEPLGSERCPLADALDRVLAADVIAEVDVPGFDRSNVDGFAVQASDTFGALEEQPRLLRLNDEVLFPGATPSQAVAAGTATPIATGGVVPRGADAVVMIEHTELVGDGAIARLELRRSVGPGGHITFAGTDVARGETVLRRGQRLTSREIGVLAAIGRAEVDVNRRPCVAIVSTGDEIVAPGQPLPAGCVYDSNAAILAAAVRELGGEPVPLGAAPDDEARLEAAVQRGLDCDLVLLSGGTSKGAGDLSYRVVSRLTDPGIVAHGVALKPGKPICLAVTAGKPVVILPGFPTSAVFTFHEFVEPVIRAYAGLPPESREAVAATMPVRVNSERGRTEYVLVGLVRTAGGLAAYPMGKGSGSVTTFSNADGFVTIGPQRELIEAGSTVTVQRLGTQLQPAELVAIGSHCIGLDFLLGLVQQAGYPIKVLHVGSTGGLAAADRGECDLAGVHLLDAATGEYNRPFLTPRLDLIPGYQRMQGCVYRADDGRFAGKSAAEIVQEALCDSACRLVNRNAGSGTRILIDQLLEGHQPPGYAVQVRSHNAVVAAIAQHRADWGVAIETVARQAGLGFAPLKAEHYDFVVPRERRERPAVKLFCELLASTEVRRRLAEMGFGVEPDA